MPGQDLHRGPLRKFLYMVNQAGNRTLITVVSAVSEVYPLDMEIISSQQQSGVALPAPAAGERGPTAGAAEPFLDRLHWHRILNHAPISQIRKAQKNGTVVGLENANLGPAIDDNKLCDACIRGALTADPFPSVDREAKAPLELLHVDLFASEWGDSVHGHSYTMLVKDEHTQNLWGRNLKTKDEAPGELIALIRQVERQYNFPVKRIQTDGETTLGRIIDDIPASGAHFKIFCDELGILKVVSAPSNPQSNGVAERMVRYVKEKVNILMIERNIPKNLWNYVVTYVVKMHNVLPKTKTLRRGPGGKPMSPNELLTGKKPDVSKEHSFYAECWAYDAKHLTKGERAARCNYLGMAQHTYGFLVRDVATGRIFPARTVVFNERFSRRSPGTFEEIDQQGHTVILESPPQMPRFIPGIPDTKPSWWDDTMPIKIRPWPPSDQTWMLGYVANRQRHLDPAALPVAPPAKDTTAIEATVQKLAEKPAVVPREQESRRSTRDGAGKRLATGASVLDEWIEIRRQHEAIKECQRQTEGDPAADDPGEYPAEIQAMVATALELEWEDWSDRDPNFDESERVLLTFAALIAPHNAAFDATSQPMDSGIYPAVAAPHRIFAPVAGRDYILVPATDVPVDVRPPDATDNDGALPVAHASYFDPTANRMIPVPRNRKEAMASKEWDHWRRAELEELKSIHEQGVFEEVKLEPGKHSLVLKCHFVYDLKVDKDGNVTRYKARLVADGNRQTPDMYLSTFAAVPTYASFRLLLTIAAHLDLELFHVDIKTAFLHAVIDTEVYLSPPPEYKFSNPMANVLKLLKSLYGLKQAMRLFNAAVAEFLAAHGFRRLYSESCLFVKHVGNNVIFVLAYVDDILMAGPDALIQELVTALKTKFTIGSAERLSFYLGMQVVRDRTRRQITICQRGYLEQFLREQGWDTMTIKYPERAVPLREKYKKLVPATAEDLALLTATERDEVKTFPYKAIIGSLLHVVMCTRPDMAFAVIFLSRFSTSFSTRHIEAVRELCRYASVTRDFGLTLGGSNDDLRGWCDADFKGCESTSKSTSGIVVTYRGSPVIWRAKRQSIVAQSTTEAEYVAQSHCTREILYLQNILKELRLPVNGSTPLMADNSSAIRLAENPEFHDRSKHIAVKYHLVRQMVEDDVIKVHWVSSDDQMADIFTKPLPPELFHRHRLALRLRKVDPDAMDLG